MQNFLESTLMLALFMTMMGIIGAAFGSNKSYLRKGFIYGFFLGPIGWLIILIGKSKVQRLLELKQALDAGAISQTEFDAEKRRIN